MYETKKLAEPHDVARIDGTAHDARGAGKGAQREREAWRRDGGGLRECTIHIESTQ